MAMGDESCPRGHGFKFRRHIQDGLDIFFTFICCKNCIVCLKRPKIYEKEAGLGSFFKEKFAKFEIYIKHSDSRIKTHFCFYL